MHRVMGREERRLKQKSYHNQLPVGWGLLGTGVPTGLRSWFQTCDVVLDPAGGHKADLSGSVQALCGVSLSGLWVGPWLSEQDPVPSLYPTSWAVPTHLHQLKPNT